jgi:hypothetical protein
MWKAGLFALEVGVGIGLFLALALTAAYRL